MIHSYFEINYIFWVFITMEYFSVKMFSIVYVRQQKSNRIFRLTTNCSSTKLFSTLSIENFIITEAKEEYIARYLNGNIGKHTWPPTDSYVPNLTDQTKSDHGPLSPDLTSRLPPLDITPEEAAQLGYMPQRDDFERVKSDFSKI